LWSCFAYLGGLLQISDVSGLSVEPEQVNRKPSGMWFLAWTLGNKGIEFDTAKCH